MKDGKNIKKSSYTDLFKFLELVCEQLEYVEIILNFKDGEKKDGKKT